MPYQWPRYDHTNDCWTARDPTRRLCCPSVPAGQASLYDLCPLVLAMFVHKYKCTNTNTYKYKYRYQNKITIMLSICPRRLSFPLRFMSSCPRYVCIQIQIQIFCFLTVIILYYCSYRPILFLSKRNMCDVMWHWCFNKCPFCVSP